MTEQGAKKLHTLAMANVAIWAIALIALLFVGQDAPGARKMLPILGGGAVVGINLVVALARVRKEESASMPVRSEP